MLRLRSSPLNIPPIAYATTERSGIYAIGNCDFRPEPAVCSLVNRASVARLLPTGNPPAILGRIWSVIVDAFDRHAVRSLAHIGKKVLKTIHPARANRNAARPIFDEVRIVRVAASRPHASVNFKFWRALAARLVAVPQRAGAKNVSLEAPTGFGGSGQKARLTHSEFRSAVASDVPVMDAGSAASYRLGAAYDRQSAISETGFVEQLWHDDSIVLFVGRCNVGRAVIKTPLGEADVGNGDVS